MYNLGYLLMRQYITAIESLQTMQFVTVPKELLLYGSLSLTTSSNTNVKANGQCKQNKNIHYNQKELKERDRERDFKDDARSGSNNSNDNYYPDAHAADEDDDVEEITDTYWGIPSSLSSKVNSALGFSARDRQDLAVLVSRAVGWLRRASEGGVVEATFQLGLIYEQVAFIYRNSTFTKMTFFF
jgi:TPR repeat protein